MEEYIRFLSECRAHIMEMVAAIDASEEQICLQMLLNNMEELSLLIDTWEENSILLPEQTTQLTTDLLFGITNNDMVIIRDVLKYGFMDVISQLIGEEDVCGEVGE